MNLETTFGWIAGFVAAFALATGVWFGSRGPSPRAVEVSPVTPLLGITLPDLDGKDQAIAQWKGKILVVNFWATWCAPCREEMPMFVRVQDAARAKACSSSGSRSTTPTRSVGVRERSQA